MPNTMDGLFGVHAKAVQMRAQRSKVLASNLANADTPNFKAKDLDFASVLKKASGQNNTRVVSTHPKHIPLSDSGTAATLKYRSPFQASLDGNTVENDMEQTRFAENAIRYQASLDFLSGKSKSFLTAIKGE